MHAKKRVPDQKRIRQLGKHAPRITKDAEEDCLSWQARRRISITRAKSIREGGSIKVFGQSGGLSAFVFYIFPFALYPRRLPMIGRHCHYGIQTTSYKLLSMNRGSGSCLYAISYFLFGFYRHYTLWHWRSAGSGFWVLGYRFIYL